jgi:uncharacterized membrane protein YdjX (TVP38/TMEM64 family)
MWQLIRPMLPMVVILAIPIVPFLLFGEQMEARLHHWREHPPAKHWVALAVIGLLASDILLPVPSSVVCVLAGDQLDAIPGTIVAWLGMNLGAVLGFALAKGCGPTVARWFSRDSDLQRAGVMAERFGPPLLALARGVPVLAEATVLWMGLHGLSWRAFLPPVVLSNLALAVVYCVIGDFAGLAIALAASVAIPVALAVAARRWQKNSQKSPPGGGG